MREGQAVSQYIGLYLTGLIDTRTLHYQYQIIDRFLGVTIWVTDSRGYIWSSHNSTQLEEVDWENEKLTVDEFVQVLEGNTITRVGRFGESFPVPVMMVGMLKINDKIRHLSAFPIQGINRTLQETHRSIGAPPSSPLFCPSSCIYDPRITRPLIQMNMISRKSQQETLKAVQVKPRRSDILP